MKREAHGTQQPRHINQIDEEASTAQRSDSPVQSINQRFLSNSGSLGFMTLIRGVYNAMSTNAMKKAPVS
ncbi:hypothetical protein [Nitrosomonas sp. Nm166]|uniref:hypothetical protein n=1 Tax=Nitrosomonas sp. Nm166 TaxID=1881054 RepID=UPI000B89BB37|nr:hypothetical protein [Nitrosomonas sp. Nm166]